MHGAKSYARPEWHSRTATGAGVFSEGAMSSISKSYCGGGAESDGLRYGHGGRAVAMATGAVPHAQTAAERRPVTVCIEGRRELQSPPPARGPSLPEPVNVYRGGGRAGSP